VDFYADWCGPCRAMAPALDAFAAANVGRALVLKLDTDANPATASRFAIRSIPTLISFQGGKEWRRHIGGANRAILDGLVT
jgi:thioredoxin